MLAYSTLPVQAALVTPENCPHQFFATDMLSVPTGNYDYRESGHYAEYGISHECPRCGYVYYTDITFEWHSHHELGGPTLVLTPDGGEIRYYCEFEGCPWYGIYE